MSLWQWLPGLILDGVMLFGTLLLTAKRRSGWLVSGVLQVLWITYAIVSQQWGFIPGIIGYSYAAARGWVKWGHDDES